MSPVEAHTLTMRHTVKQFGTVKVRDFLCCLAMYVPVLGHFRGGLSLELVLVIGMIHIAQPKYISVYSQIGGCDHLCRLLWNTSDCANLPLLLDLRKGKIIADGIPCR